MASVSGINTIVLKGRETGRYEEGTLTGTGYPGMNVVLTEASSVYGRDTYSCDYSEYLGTGTDISTVVPNLAILMEDSMEGGTVDDAYASGDSVPIWKPKKGDILQVLVLSGQTVSKTSGLTAGSDGKFIVDATNPSLQALESSGGALGADTLVRAEVL